MFSYILKNLIMLYHTFSREIEGGKGIFCNFFFFFARPIIWHIEKKNFRGNEMLCRSFTKWKYSLWKYIFFPSKNASVYFLKISRLRSMTYRTLTFSYLEGEYSQSIYREKSIWKMWRNNWDTCRREVPFRKYANYNNIEIIRE